MKIIIKMSTGLAAPSDTFSNNQNPNTTITYNAGTSNWSPPSDRTTGANTFINTLFANSIYVSGGPGSITYNYVPYGVQDFRFMREITFSSAFTDGSATVTITFNTASLGNISFNANVSSVESSLSVPINITEPLGAVNSVSLSIIPDNASTNVVINTLNTSFCLVHGSKIKTLDGYKNIENLQRGDEIVGGKIARVIKEEIDPFRMVEMVIFPKDSLEKNLPEHEIMACSEHYFVYQGKRRMAKCFLSFPLVKYKKGYAKDILPCDDEKRYFLYDIQFEEEKSYNVSGMISQSRSPFASVSPLPKELYFNPEKYSEVRVKNTLTLHPEISFLYLLPDGREVESFTKFIKRE